MRNDWLGVFYWLPACVVKNVPERGGQNMETIFENLMTFANFVAAKIQELTAINTCERRRTILNTL